MAAKRDIEITRGQDYTHVVTIQTRVSGVATPTNITGRTYTASIKRVKTQATPDASFVCTVTDGPGGEVTLTMADTVTETLDVGCYHWDLWQNTSGADVPILKGEAKVVQGVTG